jgi:GLPGLI family protein
MKNYKAVIILAILLVTAVFSFAQKNVSEGTLIYDVTIQNGSKEPQMTDAVDGATVTVYVRGGQSRSDMVSALGKETTIHDSKTGNAVILKEYSGQKLMITLTKENWEQKNKVYNNIKFEITEETKTIAGYTCKKAIANMGKDKTFIVYFTTELVMANKDYNATFKNLPGVALQYEYETATTKYRYTLSKISLDPVPVSRFDFPKSGYRVMTYEENQRLLKGNGQ